MKYRMRLTQARRNKVHKTKLKGLTRTTCKGNLINTYSQAGMEGNTSDIKYDKTPIEAIVQ